MTPDSDQLPGILAALEMVSELYSPLSPDIRTQLATHATLRQLGRQEILVKEGEYSRDLYFLISGSARAYYLKDGRDITDWFAFEGEFITALPSYFQGIPSPHFVESIEPCRLLSLPGQVVGEFCNRNHAMERLAHIAVTRTMLQLQQRVVSLQFETAQQKYENLLAFRPDITRRVPLSHIASHLGITLETLSRIRSQRS